MSDEIVWQALLAALTRAGLDYERFHRVITIFLVSRDCGADAEWLTDITIDRVAKAIHLGEEVRSVVAYSKRFAHFVWLEYLDDREKLKKALRNWTPYARTTDEVEEKVDLRRRCQQTCLQRLDKSEYQLLVDYYLTATDREALARELGLLIATLRTKIHRIKRWLERCVEICRRTA